MELSYVISQGLFLKAVAFVYMAAFGSLAVQVKGLYGSKGIMPIQNSLDSVSGKIGGRELYFRAPSVFWISSTDKFIVFAAWLGTALPILVFLGVYPAVILSLLLILYYSFLIVGYPFLNFQWDILLIEVGFLSVIYAVQSPPPLLLTYLMWFLLFRFMFSSGIAKLIHGSREWKDLTAMNYHYETQPLPTKPGYYAHQQPKFLLKLSTLSVHLLEVIAPFLIFTTNQVRAWAFVVFTAFQLMIQFTGNFAFFNLLTIAMGIPLLADHYLQSFAWIAGFTPIFRDNAIVEWVLSGIAALFIFLNALELATFFFRHWLVEIILRPFRMYSLINSYGLFVHMTTHRDEIIVEGSDDGVNWLTYEFLWKPGDLKRGPRRMAPHQPRLDWQMWFAALSSVERNFWFKQFLNRILEGSKDVLDLLETNPFPDKPPRYLRSSLYRYHFTDLKTKGVSGAWWTREFRREYTPIYTLRSETSSTTTYF